MVFKRLSKLKQRLFPGLGCHRINVMKVLPYRGVRKLRPAVAGYQTATVQSIGHISRARFHAVGHEIIVRPHRRAGDEISSGENRVEMSGEKQ